MTDPFSSARDAFVKQEHVNGRLLLITPLSSGERESNLPGSQGKTYTYIETDTVVLDGDVDDMIDEVPMLLEGFQYSGQAITAQLLPAVRKSTMVLGRLGQKPSATKGFGPAWVLMEPTEEDKMVARKYLADEAERKASATPVDPFGNPAADTA
jgi:hypothetical protein